MEVLDWYKMATLFEKIYLKENLRWKGTRLLLFGEVVEMYTTLVNIDG